MLARIPAEYRELDLATIQPQSDRHAKQDALIDAVRQDPGASLFLAGRNGTGKTMIGWLLYKRAIEEGRPAVFLSMAELLRQLRTWEMDSEKLPIIEPTGLRESKQRWFIGIDEADKARPTEFASEMIFLILDAIYSGRHQLVMTTNLDLAGLRDHWARASEVWGNSIMRRITDLNDMVDVSLFE